jgi:2-oxoglutarate dehydrogenase E1 component
MAHPLDFFQHANADYIEEMYARYRQDPSAVTADWALFFAGLEIGGSGAPAEGPPPAGVPGIFGVHGLVHAYREFGHLLAHLDPLGTPPASHPYLELERLGFRSADLDTAIDPRPFQGEAPGTLRGLIDALRDTYCRTLGVELEEVEDPAQREWLAARMEPVRNRPAIEPAERERVLARLLTGDAFEQFLHVRYVGQKRFSLEGATTLLPMLDALVDAAATHGVEQIVMGMPHRGRLNVLAHTLGKPYADIFREFETQFAPEDESEGDVKYHLGYSNTVTTPSGKPIHLDLIYNPSHLEFVNPVVLGSVRAKQGLMGDRARTRVMPVLLHGDASFSGEGVVPETLAMAALPAYETGGTVHVVVNNQVGFTTSPESAHPGRYCTDIARVIGAPVFHVNGDDPETAVHAIRLAFAYRMEFKRDVIVDLVCYRRHGHNELDDPTFTQPLMYRQIAAHTPASRAYAERLVGENALDRARVTHIEQEIERTLQAAHQRTRSEPPVEKGTALAGAWVGLDWAGDDWSAETTVPRATLEGIVRRSAAFPDGFHPHPKVQRLLADRVEMLAQDRIDWGLGEALAYGSLLLEGRNVRLSGQDTGRGTFSHRHAVLRDQENGARHVPLEHLADSQGRFEVIDSPLNEAGCLGFEYGFTTADPHTLTVWEAQFGDFANVGQVIIDQFLASAEAKWRRMSGLVLLLPHGYEGQGPEHSSARLERFLELCASRNLQVCNFTTPAQLFHALRRQLLRSFRKPLVVMSPKSLLRHKRSVSSVAEFTDAGFQTVIDDPAATDPAAVRRVLMLSGKVYFTMLEAREARTLGDLALVRVEQLYPFPRTALGEVLRRYPNARDIRWVQEEPANMGAWRHLRHRIEGILPSGATLSLAARKAAPTPATGYHALHAEQEREMVDRALCEVGALRPRRPQARRSAGRGR